VAYFINDDEEDKKQEQSTTLAPGAVSSGATPVPASGGGGSLTPAPQNQQTAQQKQGTGFTNLSSWLDAGKGRDKLVSDTGGGLLSTEKSTFDTAVKPLQDATFQTQSVDDKELTGLLSAPGDEWKSKLGGLLSQDYTGPMSVDYDPGKGKSFDNLKGLDALSSTDTTGAELAKRTAPTPIYNAGSRRLDNTLFGADSASQTAIGSNKTGATDFLTGAEKTSGELAKKAQGFKEQAASARDATRGQLKTASDNILSNLDRQVQAFNFGEDQKAMGKPTESAGVDEFGRPMKWTDYQAGNRATRENMISEQDASALSRLGELIGAPQIKRGGDAAKKGEWSRTWDDEQAPMLQDSSEFTYSREGPDPKAAQDQSFANTLAILLSGGLAMIPTAIAGEQSGPDSQWNRAKPNRGVWRDKRGNEVSDYYRRDPTTGIVTDPMTGEKFLQSDIDKGNVVLNPETGKYEIVVKK